MSMTKLTSQQNSYAKDQTKIISSIKKLCRASH